MTDPSVTLFLAIFGVATVLGVVIAYSGFCTFGAIADWVSFGEPGRLGAWLLAMAVAIFAVALLETFGYLMLTDSVVPYRSTNLNPARYLVGGTIFGIGMHLSSGCSSKAIVAAGGGSIRAATICCFAAISAYLLTYTPLFESIFHPIISLTNIDLSQWAWSSQRLDGWLDATQKSPITAAILPIMVALTVGVCSLTMIAKSHRKKLFLSGIVVGLSVAAGWWLSGGVLGQAWIEDKSFDWQPPRNVGAQSFTFISPLGDAVAVLVEKQKLRSLTFGLFGVLGLFFGSFIYHAATKTIRFDGFTSRGGFFRAAIGGTLLGVGGILALGCTIGQGITGISTFALGSILATLSMVAGAATAVNIEYYFLLHPEKANLLSAFISTLVDFRLLPNRWRVLEKF